MRGSLLSDDIEEKRDVPQHFYYILIYTRNIIPNTILRKYDINISIMLLFYYFKKHFSYFLIL